MRSVVLFVIGDIIYYMQMILFFINIVHYPR